MEEVKNRIKLTEENIAEAKSVNDTARRDRLEAYLIELQKEKNFHLQVAAPGNFHPFQDSLQDIYFYLIRGINCIH